MVSRPDRMGSPVAIITISRGSLSGGRTLAECLAEHLGYPTIADEVLEGAARELGIPEEAVTVKFKGTPGLWAQLSREREKYVLAVQTALAERCRGGELVYHGLAGQLLLRGLSGVLRVRLIAPMEMRVRALVSGHHRMRAREAEDFIRSVDRERKRWVKLMYGEDVEDPLLYDLTVNLRTLSMDAACATVAEAAAQPGFAVSEDVRERIERFAEECHQRLRAMTAEG